MRLLLTGADGFTGQHFAATAEKAGFSVWPMKADLTDEAAVGAEVVACAPMYIVHLAAISAVTHADEEAFYRVNLFGTLNLLKALEKLKTRPSKILLVSSANVYGNCDGGAITESLCPKPVNHYAMSKLAMEHMAITYADRLPIVITRPFNYTGVGHDLRFVIPKIVDHFVRNAPSIELGNLNVFREYNDVQFVCKAYLALLQKGVVGEVYNICTGKMFSLNDIIDRLARITNHQMAVYSNPAFIRPNEIEHLCGDPRKLENLIGPVHKPDIEDTLRSMLVAGSP